MPNPAAGGTLADIEPQVAQRVAKLSEGQLDCLRLVAQHLSSKEIAVELGISPHTVDQRVRQALIHQPPYIETAAAAADPGGAVSNQIRHADRAGEAWGSTGLNTEQKHGLAWSSLQLPFATRSHPRNEMSVGLRLLWILMIAAGAAFSAGMYLAGLESLSRLLQG